MSADPDLARIRDVLDRYPVSRSWLYRQAASGHVRLVKPGAATLVDVGSVRAVLATLPEANVHRTPRT